MTPAGPPDLKPFGIYQGADNRGRRFQGGCDQVGWEATFYDLKAGFSCTR